MSQTPNPHDPNASPSENAVPEPTTDPEIAQADGSGTVPDPHPGPAVEPGTEQGQPSSDPALHPHDPYAYDPGPAPQPQPGHAAPDTAGPGSYGAQHPGPDAHDPYAAPSGQASPEPYGARPGPAGGAGYGPQPGDGAPAGAAGASGHGPRSGPGGDPGHGPQPGPSGGPGYGGQQPGATAQGQPPSADLNVPPYGFKGAYDGPLSGQPMRDSDAKTWALVVHLAALLQFVIPFLGGLIAQIILYVVFKDRNRFVRYNASEALNGTIAAMIVSLILGVLFTVITIITLGIGSFLFGLMFLPTAVQAIFAIIGAVKAYQGEWWNYPVNVRLVK